MISSVKISQRSFLVSKFEMNRPNIKLIITFCVIWHYRGSITSGSASLAQWLEHWSCKPGVESSNLSRGCRQFFFLSLLIAKLIFFFFR